MPCRSPTGDSFRSASGNHAIFPRQDSICTARWAEDDLWTKPPTLSDPAIGFPDPVLQFASTSWSGFGEVSRLIRAGDVEAAAALVQPWQVAVGVGAQGLSAGPDPLSAPCAYSIPESGCPHVLQPNRGRRIMVTPTSPSRLRLLQGFGTQRKVDAGLACHGRLNTAMAT